MPSTLSSDAYRKCVDEIVAARKEAGLTQVQLSERLGKPQQFVSRYENYERRIDIVELVVIARALRADPTVLFNKILQKVPTTTKL